ncbi:MAG: M24 family metallopeptidase [bacterium]|nr:M24 family metallopeptidase [bacterium]
MLKDRIPEIQKALAQMGVDGWFFSCFQQSDPVALELLGLTGDHLVTRRCYYLIPAQGEPRRLMHKLEPRMLAHLPGSESHYLTWAEHRQGLEALMAGCTTVAAQYSPNNALPAVSRLDAGTVELLSGLGVGITSSADLVQKFAAVWSDEQLASHRRANTHLHEIVLLAFDLVADTLKGGNEIQEYKVQQFILEQFDKRGMWTESPPIVGANEHSADPHYQPGPDLTTAIKKGDFLLIDLWAKEKPEVSGSGAIYGDITWCGVCRAEPTEREIELWSTAVAARDAGWQLIADNYPSNVVRGFEVDDATRNVIEAAGFGEWFIHRTGHSIGIQDHGQGANMDNLETHDTRPLEPMTGFSIEPGIYLPGEFGVRTEINVALTPEAAEITGAAPQIDLLRLLA